MIMNIKMLPEPTGEIKELLLTRHKTLLGFTMKSFLAFTLSMLFMVIGYKYGFMLSMLVLQAIGTVALFSYTIYGIRGLRMNRMCLNGVSDFKFLGPSLFHVTRYPEWKLVVVNGDRGLWDLPNLLFPKTFRGTTLSEVLIKAIPENKKVMAIHILATKMYEIEYLKYLEVMNSK